MKNSSLKNSILLTCLFIAVIWCIKSYELMFHQDLVWLGVYPQQMHGLLGIITAPLVHGSLEHIFNNTLSILLLGSFILYGYPKSRWRVIIFVWSMSGVGVWMFAREAYHIGASGLTHGLFFYLFVVSLFRRDKSSIAIMMAAFFMYGGMTMTIFPREEGISFEYHLFGGLSGAIAAILWHRLDPKPEIKRYEWELEQPEDDPVIGEDWKDQQADQPTNSSTQVPINIKRDI